MKFKTFRMLVIGGAVALVGTAVWQCRGRPEEQRAHDREVLGLDAPQPAPVASRVADVRPVAAAGSADVPALAGGPVAGHPSPEAYLLAILGKPADADKLKDVTSGVGAKINVYNEGGAWARAKVDHDRDEKWDEKWSLDGSVFVRQIAPNDDEQYTRELRRSGADAPWFDPAAPVATPTPTQAAPPAAPSTGRELDDTMLRLLSAPVEEKIKDAAKDRPYKINLYSDDKLRWSRAKVDLDRDEKWDEKWDFNSDGVVERQVAPADDEQYSETYRLVGGAWIKQ